MRDNKWLQSRLEKLWNRHFSDVPKVNHVHICFGRKSKKILGSTREMDINSKYSKTRIMINGFYRDFSVPDDVVDATIAHEICHYAHGFSSPLPQIHPHPHKGGIVDKEITERGLGDRLEFQREWLEKSWNDIVGSPVF